MPSTLNPVLLRPYQESCLRAIRDRLNAGVRLQLVSMATGTGKSVVFAMLSSFLGLRGKVLVVSHRDELLKQSIRHFQKQHPECMVSFEKAGHHSHPKSSIVVASVQTLGRDASGRIQKFDPSEFDAEIIDEAHHSLANTYRNVIKHFGLDQRKDVGRSSKRASTTDRKSPKLLIGFTATPNRGDGRALGSVFDEIVFSYSILDAIDDGWHGFFEKRACVATRSGVLTLIATESFKHTKEAI